MTERAKYRDFEPGDKIIHRDGDEETVYTVEGPVRTDSGLLRLTNDNGTALAVAWSPGRLGVAAGDWLIHRRAWKAPRKVVTR